MFTGAQQQQHSSRTPQKFIKPGDLCIVHEGLRLRLAIYVRPHAEGRGGWVHIFDTSRRRWQVGERLRSTIRPATARELARYAAPPAPQAITAGKAVR